MEFSTLTESIKSSIVITNYNQGIFLNRSINSALNQSANADSYEVIVVDDGSTDDSVNIIKNIIRSNRSRNIRIVEKSNGGTSSARNAGIKEATGEYIGFLDADDEYLPKKLALSTEYLSLAEEVGLVYSDYFEINSMTNTTRYAIKPDFNYQKLKVFCIVSTNSFIKKSIIPRVGLFNETIRIIEDYDYWLRIVNSGYMALRIPEPLFNYYQHGNNKTVTSSREDIELEHRNLNR